MVTTEEVEATKTPTMRSTSTERCEPSNENISLATDTPKRVADDLEQRLMNIVADLLNLDTAEVDLTGKFCDLGGNSLIGTRLLARWHRSENVAIPLCRLFEVQTLSDLRRFVIS